MRAMILAAGRGERLRPHTDTTPKPLLKVGRWRLIEYQIIALKKAGIDQVVVNVSWLAEKIRSALGSGDRYGVEIIYSDETGQSLETAEALERAASALPDAAEGIRPANGDPTRLLELLDADTAARVLEWLLGNEAADGAELAGLWAEDPGAGAEALLRVEAERLPKAASFSLQRESSP